MMYDVLQDVEEQQQFVGAETHTGSGYQRECLFGRTARVRGLLYVCIV